jgi:hypothetical protein
MRRVATVVALLIVLGHVGTAAARGAEGPRPELLQAALAAAHRHGDRIRNRDVVAVIDYGLPSNRARLFLVDPTTGETQGAYLVAHGRGSDPELTGRATRFSNATQSKASSLGAFVTGETYQGAHGRSLRLIGLDATNDRAQARAIVVHGAPYVASGRKVLGHSWGCPAVEPRFVNAIIDRLRGGALLYIGN